MTPIEERVSRLEGIIEQINERLRALEQGQESLREELRHLGAEGRGNFRWTVGIMLAMWITIIGAVLGALLTR